MLTSLQINELKELLNKPKRIVITTHKNPDGDAMGSSLGLYHYLIQKKHQVTVVVPTPYPQFLYCLPANSEVVVFSEKNHADDGALIPILYWFFLNFVVSHYDSIFHLT